MVGEKTQIDIVVPMHNESANIAAFIKSCQDNLKETGVIANYIFIDDGSKDDPFKVIKANSKDLTFRFLKLSRNFGKEVALSVGLQHSKGQAAIMLDADLQHPPRYLPEFIQKWRNGARIVIGVRTEHGKDSHFKKVLSNAYNSMISKISKVDTIQHATDFRLLDKTVVAEFNRFTERGRIVRGLIDWMGFRRDIVYFEADKRFDGQATYSYKKLFKLGVDSIVSMSMFPLRISGLLGVMIVIFSLPLGALMFFNSYFGGNSMQFTGPAKVGVLITFLVGVTLINMGLLSLYIAKIHHEVANRPLFIVEDNLTNSEVD